MSCNHFYVLDQWEFHNDSWNASGLRIHHTPCKVLKGHQSQLYQASHGDAWACVGCFAAPPQKVVDVILLGRLGSSPRYEKPIGFYGVSFGMAQCCQEEYPDECGGQRLTDEDFTFTLQGILKE